MMDRRIVREGDNLFWRVSCMKEDFEVKKIQSKVIDVIRPFRAKRSLRQIQDNLFFLNERQKQDIEFCGVYWGLPHNFDPHITLAYKAPSFEKEEALFDSFILPNIIFDVSQVALVKLGYYGNVEEVMLELCD